MGSCDSLVCLLVPGIFLIYNPTTREHRELPIFSSDGEYEVFYGFGYDSRSNDYKVVEGLVFGKWDVAIFSLKLGSWRRILAEFETESHLLVSHQGVYWNGVLHWCVQDESLKPGSVIMSFDLSEERFHRETPVPEVDEDI
ncbi:hypothetical protein NL676_021388 [Syzygium grande]|nr:hypothetical protein NL676_021388 [Syzygium grande]